VQVIVPNTNAEVSFGDHKTTATGTTRTFESPRLQPGKSYSYTIRASWTEGGQTVTADRVVEISAGKTSVVDFTNGNSGASQSP
jgi:uncharacterized protein (TIGR03000 family)